MAFWILRRVVDQCSYVSEGNTAVIFRVTLVHAYAAVDGGGSLLSEGVGNLAL